MTLWDVAGKEYRIKINGAAEKVGKTPFVKYFAQNMDLTTGINDLYIPGEAVDGFNQYLLSAYAYATNITTTPLSCEVNASGDFRILVNSPTTRTDVSVRYCILYLPKS